MSVTLAEFVETMDGAPVELHEIADNAILQLDEDDIQAADLLNAARDFIRAKEAFQIELEAVGIEEG